MSISRSEPTVRLNVQAPDLTTEIFVIDSRFRRLASGLGHLETVYKTVMHGDIAVEELEGFEQIQAGTLSRVEYDMFLGDLVNFMVYIAEPVQVERRSMGWKVLLFLIVLFGFAYALKKEYWKDVH